MAMAVDHDSLIARIKVTAPASIDFTEIRFSPLLRQPVIVEGRLGFLGVDQLDRIVEKPFRERTEIRSRFVKVARDGESERTFALDRAPELRTLLRTFSALLTGDRAELERHFELRVVSDSGNPAWTLELTPRDSRLRRRLKSVSVIGAGTAPRCFAIASNDGGLSVMLIGTTGALPASLTPETLQKRCRATDSQ
jgi:hypothetical protein